MKSLLLKALILFCILFYFSGCDNSDGQKIVGVGNGNGTGNNPPAIPSEPSPANNATGTSNNITLMWTCSDPDVGDTVKYDIYLDPVSPPMTKVVSDYTPTTYGYGVVNHNLTLYWKVVAHDLKGASTSGPVWTFRTAP
jgi:hypothetical protein